MSTAGESETCAVAADSGEAEVELVVARNVTDAPAPEAPGLFIFHPAHLEGRQAGKEVKSDIWRWRIREAPDDHSAIDWFAVLNETPRSVNSGQRLGQGRIRANKVTSQKVGRIFLRPLRGVLSIEE
ncbi:hypothetical protein E2C01_021959 [Portunus trituberculatus]|uniref:Uncharacterized protein n=1 Tax=Portunus trituberculatus TaxID=210409 RepID=A0A5B7E5S2_PORTR|nr:hypothetical protein [Portunus trituberculatus]